MCAYHDQLPVYELLLVGEAPIKSLGTKLMIYNGVYHITVLKSTPSGGPSSTTLLCCAAVEGFTEAEVLVAVEAEPVACTVEVTVSWLV